MRIFWLVALSIVCGCHRAPSAGLEFVGLPDSPHVAMAVDDLRETYDESGDVRVVRVTVTVEEGPGEYSFTSKSRRGFEDIELRADDPAAVAHGLYELADVWGARWYHPEESAFVPATVRAPVDGVREPAFERRGFHEHTKHPLPAADYYLVPSDEHREALRRYFRWLARNRQNMASFVLLKTVDLDEWVPYMRDVVADAHDHGVELGFVLSFADNQQNAFRILDFEGADDAARIRTGLDVLGETGVDFLTFQLGTSEFTSPDAGQLLGWMDAAQKHAATEFPDLELSAWIHITCGLKTEDGGYYYHVPLDADPSWTVWPHTVFFYTLEHPAPVYGCGDFGHQVDFIDAAAEQGRRQVFVPESAWWLGFDNNLPVGLPITGWSREWDIQKTAGVTQDHLLFTTGREWGYWQYDYYTARASWDASLTWSDFVDELTSLFGDDGESAAAIGAVTELQRRHFYEERPDLYFYVAGELPQDEIGARADILARPTRPMFDDVWNLSAADFATWQADDLARLDAVGTEYEAALAELPARDGATFLYRENRAALQLFAMRIEHAVALYQALVDVRELLREPEDDRRAELRELADQRLEEARAITTAARSIIADIEPGYRYPSELLNDDRDNPTVYDFGYLHHTHTAYFWTRRDDQLARFLDSVFDASPDAWPEPPLQVYFADESSVEMLVPESEAAGSALKSFIPTMLLGVERWNPSTAAMTTVIATDDNDNGKPDGAGVQRTVGSIDGSRWTADDAVFGFAVNEETSIDVVDPVFELEVERDGANLQAIGVGELRGHLDSSALVGTMVAIAGLDEDGARRLLKLVYGISTSDDLPELLPFEVRFHWEPLDR